MLCDGIKGKLHLLRLAIALPATELLADRSRGGEGFPPNPSSKPTQAGFIVRPLITRARVSQAESRQRDYPLFKSVILPLVSFTCDRLRLLSRRFR